MPAERCKKSQAPVAVPRIGDPDRKRVLSLLAQRRYRQRRREKIAALEAQAKAYSPIPDSAEHHVIEPALDAHSHVLLQDAGDKEFTCEKNMIGGGNEPYAMFLEEDSLDLDFMHNFQAFPGLPSPLPSTPSSSSPQFPLTPDGAILTVPMLNVVRVLSSIALTFDVTEHIWDPSHLHVLPQSIVSRVAALPVNLHPIPVQFTIPHHPVLDLLPWPSVREKLICMLSLPSAFRPPVAQEEESGDNIETLDSTGSGCSMATSSIPIRFSGDHHVKQSTAIVQLVQDLDDLQDDGGLRVNGNTSTWSEGNELIEDAWEIGSAFYRKWWWCVDQKIVDVSNRRRRERGLPRLRVAT